ncbi:MAG: hypothetical protein KYX64_05865 [Sphingopyxis sp.]|nr:hypothetical protein [Sphingopyxis sp.]
MILALALMAVAQAPDPVPTDEEIVVIAQKLSGISVYIGRDAKGRYQCDLSESSGNARLDAQLCKTSATCVKKGASNQAEVKACIDKRKSTLLANFRREWMERRR